MSRSLVDRLAQGPAVLLDGATGTELARRGIDLSSPSWTASVLLDQPEVLAAIHRDYAAAGAELITANTFRTHARNLRSLGQERNAGRLTRTAVEIARSAVPPEVWIAASVAPLEDCYSPHLTPSLSEIEFEHQAMARSLAEADVDFVLIETQVTIREAVCAARAVTAVGLPFAVSFVGNAEGQLLSGENLADAFQAVAEFSPCLLGVNCLPCAEVLPALAATKGIALHIPRCAYANTGKLTAQGTWVLTEGRDPAVYAVHAQAWQTHGIRLIGGCCGTTPDHITAIHSTLYS